MEVKVKDRTKDTPGVVVNPCKACAPLGASLAMKGISRSMCILHGSQGCATYIRRFFIGHFREPVDIASSSFDESTAVFGGRKNLVDAVKNVVNKYNPEVLGIATSCLSETIGEDVSMYLREIKSLSEAQNVTFLHAETAAYRGTHVDGFMKMTAAAAGLSEPEADSSGRYSDREGNRLRINMIPWMCSPADIRMLKRVFSDLKIDSVFLPDYSLSLDGGAWDGYEEIPRGGTTLREIKSMGSSDHTIQLGEISSFHADPASVIENKCGVESSILPLPVGIKNTDILLNRLLDLGKKYGKEVGLNEELKEQRSRLLDAYADSHKVVAGIRAAVYGEADFTAAMTAFLCELGIEPVVCMTGEKISSDNIDLLTQRPLKYGFKAPAVLPDSDFADLDNAVEQYKPDLLIGSSRGYKTARKFGIPLIRAGFPVHDRFGGQRLLHYGYKGALRMTDELANTITAGRQSRSPYGYMIM